jgi:hypothetical protein
MKSSNWLLVALGSIGLISIAACSNGQPAASNHTERSIALESGTASGNVLKPSIQTGAARMTLKAGNTPLKIGKNTLMLSVMDAKTGKPLAVKKIGIEMVMSAKEMKAMGMDGMGAGSAKTEVKPASMGMFKVTTNPSYGGNWQLQVKVKDINANAVFDIVVK